MKHIRRILLPLLIVSTLSVPAVAMAKAVELRPVTVPGFYGLRIPPEAMPQGKAPGGGGAIVLYTYATSASNLAVAVRQQLVRDKWKIVSDTRSPRGAIRLRAIRGKAAVAISIVRNRRGSALILTRSRGVGATRRAPGHMYNRPRK